MLYRCVNRSHFAYQQYGGRGITVCQEWIKFDGFYKDMGDRPSSSHSIERIDTNGNYEPSNCRWATAREQARNRRNNRHISIDGETHCISEWAEKLDIKNTTIRERLNRGWTEREALFGRGK
jgi:hypothetical protein